MSTRTLATLGDAARGQSGTVGAGHTAMILAPAPSPDLLRRPDRGKARRSPPVHGDRAHRPVGGRHRGATHAMRTTVNDPIGGAR
jgi:hypothetical protein